MKRYVLKTFFVVQEGVNFRMVSGRSDSIYPNLKNNIIFRGSSIACELFMSKQKSTERKQAKKPLKNNVLRKRLR